MNYLSTVFNKAVPILRETDPKATSAMKAGGDGNGVNRLLFNVRKGIDAWGRTLMMIAGIAMIVIGTFKIAQGLASHGKSQVNWTVNIMLIVIGVVFCIGTAWNKLTTGNIGNMIGNELEALGG